jgi:hypothetical protein
MGLLQHHTSLADVTQIVDACVCQSVLNMHDLIGWLCC